MQFTFFEISGDLHSGGNVTVGTSGTASIVDDDGIIDPSTQDTGPQFNIGGTDFISSAYPSSGGTIQIYHAKVNGQLIKFAYLTSSGDGIDDGVDRIVILSGTISPGDELKNIKLIPGQSQQPLPYADIPSVVLCFTPSAQITTPRGQAAVEHLLVGDLVITADNGLQAIRWIGRKRMTGARLQAFPHLRPIRIRKGAFGQDLPARDMWVSPQHRMLVSSDRTLLDLGEHEVLAPAKGLLNDYSITVDYGIRETEYIHIMFDKHEIVFANGTPTESFHPGMTSMSAIDDAARDELFEIFPELADSPADYGPSARLALRVQEARALHGHGIFAARA